MPAFRRPVSTFSLRPRARVPRLIGIRRLRAGRSCVGVFGRICGEQRHFGGQAIAGVADDFLDRGRAPGSSLRPTAAAMSAARALRLSTTRKSSPLARAIASRTSAMATGKPQFWSISICAKSARIAAPRAC
jgi:hypothetical protein